MRKLAATALALALVGAAGFWLMTRPAALAPETLAVLAAHDADAEAGELVFWAAGCAGCHTAPGLEVTAPVEERLHLSGGQEFATPFGTFTAPNISMDPEQGIGGWSLPEFARAVTLGVSPAGQHYYPAFPFTSYARATPEDIADLWAFWQSLPADATPTRAHDVGFPFTLRRGLGLWKLLNYNADFVAPARDDPQYTRGRYLVEALGHCAECHTPRDVAGGLDQAEWLTGAPNPAGDGRIPALPPEGWSGEDIAAYLQSGFTPEFDVAGGTMAEVIANLSRISAEDRAAIAAYLVTFRSSPNR
ncbi:c-type cytochrome [Pararhodobacter oceanensis]|uniref:Diacylglycerol kinase n=1 Tax=Pararhodobacter oceanensis TaxID=2172121 RepID=A0A2T8HQI8_9RHOB|nr:cytochrome c [Pararhodobacter oceanensis]PVH27690.1 diacylglycerol kinase [Pararhodobacter oceanensis]